MKRFAIPIAGLLCLALWACVQPVPSPPPPGPPAVLRSVSCPDGSDFLSHVQYVDLSVQLMPQAGSVQPNADFAVPADSTPIDPHIQADLAAAFAANPVFAKNELCPPFITSTGTPNPGLDGILINRAQCVNPTNPSDYDPSNCSGMADTDIAANSWGLRTPSNKKYVSISLGLWRCQSGRGYCAPSFTQYQQRLNKALLDKTAGMPPVGINPPMFHASNDTSDLALLAALAHERGHIHWWETFVKPPGSTPTNLVTLAGEFCGGTIYPRGQWQGAQVRLPPNRYVDFGHLSPSSPLEGLPLLLRSGAPTDARRSVGVIEAIYAGGLYPSLLAAYSSDEDFVEAYEWSVLRNARLSDVTVSFNGTGRPILHGGMGDLRGAENKLHCFNSLSH